MNRVPLVASLVSVSAGTDCGFNNDMCVTDKKGKAPGEANANPANANWEKVTGTENKDTVKGCRGLKGRVECLTGTTLAYGNSQLDGSDRASMGNSIDVYTNKIWSLHPDSLDPDPMVGFRRNPFVLEETGKGTPAYAGETWFWCVNTTGSCTGNSKKYAPTKSADYLKNMGACMYKNPDNNGAREYDYDCCAFKNVGFCDEGYKYTEGEIGCRDIHNSESADYETDDYILTKDIIDQYDRKNDKYWPSDYLYTTKCTPCLEGQTAAECTASGKNDATKNSSSAATISVFGALSSAVVAFMLV